MIKIGDRVKFLNDVGGGIVTGYINKDTVNVENQDGFEIPYPVSKLLAVDAPELSRDYKKTKDKEPEPEQIQIKKTESTEGKIMKGKDKASYLLGFVPSVQGNPLAGEIELFLINDSNNKVLFNFMHFANHQYKAVAHGIIGPNSRRKLGSIVQSELNELPVYYFQLIGFKEVSSDLEQPVTKKIKVNPVKFYRESTFYRNQYFENDAYLLQITDDILSTELDKLTEDDFREVVKEKEKPLEAPAPAPKKPVDVEEVDLHIHELIDNPAGLSNKEILDIQLDKVSAEMQHAISSGVKRIVFIHGVGQGVLKQEIARLLKNKYGKYNFQDASFKEYGYGATMVILKRK